MMACKMLTAFVVAGICAAVSWAATLFAQHSGSVPSIVEIVQFGGTGGLIVAMGVAIKWLSTYNGKLQDILAAERLTHRAEMTRLSDMMAEERGAHRKELNDNNREWVGKTEQLAAMMRAELQEQNQELLRQIAILRKYTDNKLDSNAADS